MTLKALAIEWKIDRLDIIKVKNFCSLKDTIKNVGREHIEGDKCFENYASDKGHCI